MQDYTNELLIHRLAVKKYEIDAHRLISKNKKLELRRI